MGEVAIVAEPDEDRPVQSQGGDHPGGGQVEHSPDSLFQHSFRVLPGLVGVDVQSYRLGPADGVGEADGALLRQPSGHDVLGDVPGHVGPAAVHLTAVFAGQRPAAMEGQSAVGIRHQLPARQAGVRLEAAQHKPPGRVDEHLGFRVGI